MKDDKYWARRRKNNIAAKRSRDARRVKENQIAIRASYLERENDTLRKQLDDSKRETKALKHRIAKYESIYPALANLDINKWEKRYESKIKIALAAIKNNNLNSTTKEKKRKYNIKKNHPYLVYV